MPKVYALPTSNGSNSLSDFKNILLKDHKFELIVLIKEVLYKLEEYGFNINNEYKRDTIKKLDKELYELRVKNARLMLYFDGNNFFILLHGFVKKTQKTPLQEINKAKKEIRKWKTIKSLDWLA